MEVKDRVQLIKSKKERIKELDAGIEHLKKQKKELEVEINHLMENLINVLSR